MIFSLMFKNVFMHQEISPFYAFYASWKQVFLVLSYYFSPSIKGTSLLSSIDKNYLKKKRFCFHVSAIKGETSPPTTLSNSKLNIAWE